MSPELQALIEESRHYKMSPAERFEQAISWAYGNGHMEDPRVTRDGVRREAYKLWPDGGIPENE